MLVLELMAMAACYSPNTAVEPLGFELPFDIRTGEIRQEIWQRWLAFDPVNMVDPYQDNLRQARFCYVDCGKRDQFNLWIGARQMQAKLLKFDIDHIYEEYDSDHFFNAQRAETKEYPALWPRLCLG